MDVKWLEDLQALADTGSFTKAAERRNVTQPAFSRRIQSLEHWFGVPLVDRDQRPFALHQHVLDNQYEIAQTIDLLYELRSRVLASAQGRKRVVFATQHALTVSVFPALISTIRENVERLSYRMRIGNKPECVTRFVSGEADFLVCYEAPDAAPTLPTAGAKRLYLGGETLVPVAAPELADRVAGNENQQEAMPLLAHPRDSFMGQVIERACLRELVMTRNIEVVCETAYSTGLKQLAVAGLGIAWLPDSLVADDIAAGALQSLTETFAAPELQIVMYAQLKFHTPEARSVWQFVGSLHQLPFGTGSAGTPRRKRANSGV
jgi:DNA-binding transcriptional LysR family regulator